MAKKRMKLGGGSAGKAHRLVLFADALIANGGNQTAAATAAGYTKRSAHVQGSRLISDAKVQALLAERRAKLESRSGLSVERTLRELARIAYFDPAQMYDVKGKLLDVHAMHEDTRRAIGAVEHDGETGALKKVRPFDKNAALDKAMKHFGLYSPEPLPPPEVQEEEDMQDAARRLAFILAAGEHQQKQAPKALPKPKAKAREVA